MRLLKRYTFAPLSIRPCVHPLAREAARFADRAAHVGRFEVLDAFVVSFGLARKFIPKESAGSDVQHDEVHPAEAQSEIKKLLDRDVVADGYLEQEVVALVSYGAQLDSVDTVVPRVQRLLAYRMRWRLDTNL